MFPSFFSSRHIRFSLILFLLGGVGFWAFTAYGPWLLSSSFSKERETKAVAPPPAVDGAAALFDLTTEQFLYGKSLYRPHPPGSLTKIATALTVLERVEDDSKDAVVELVQISREAAYAPGYSLLMDVGQVVPLKQLLKATLMLPTADAPIALAEHVSGSTPRFVSDMNEWAARLQLETTRFQNPHGLDASVHRTSAHDMAKLTAVAMKKDFFRRIVSQRRSGIVLGERRPRTVRNVNSFLWRFPGAVGVFSSYTPQSGYSLVGAAQRQEKYLLVVVLGASSAENRYLSAASLLEWGFQFYDVLVGKPMLEQSRYIVQEGDTLSKIARDFNVPPGAIEKLNGLSDMDRLSIGDTLWIPQ